MAAAEDASSFAETMEVVFQNTAYLVTVSNLRNENLVLEVECKQDANRWRGDFTSKYIEDITSKTGNFKKYAVFVRMLLSALKQGSDSVFVDLLTYADLEVLKARKERAAGSGGGGGGLQRALAPNNKRYLILTYAAEFDRVHFPLPLLYEEVPDPQAMKRTVVALRAEVEALQAAGGDPSAAQELRRLRQENAALREQLAAGGLGQPGGLAPEVERLTAVAKEAENELRLMRKEKAKLAERAEAAEAHLSREQASHRRETRRQSAAMAELEAQLQDAKDVARESRSKVRMLTEELETTKRRAKIADTRKAYGGASSAGRSRTTSGAGTRTAPRQTSAAAADVRPSSRSSSRAASPKVPPSPLRSMGRPYLSSASPGGSRPSSRPNSRPASAGPSPRPSSRPSSAGRASPGRFDPTAYVQQKREEQRRRDAERSRRTFSPAGSRPSSGRSTPAREDSVEYSRPRSSSYGGGTTARRSSSEGRREVGGRRTPDLHLENGGSRQPGSRPSSARGRATGSKPAASSATRRSRERPSSPGAALEDVKDRLAEYANKQHHGANEAEVSSRPRGELTLRVPDEDPVHSEFDDPAEEIADIDERLHALQNFLKAAKQGGAAGSKSSFR